MACIAGSVDICTRESWKVGTVENPAVRTHLLLGARQEMGV